MRGFVQLTKSEFKLFIREPFATFFTLVFPLFLLIVFGSIFGNDPSSLFNDFGYVDFAIPSLSALIIASSGLMTLTTYIANYREKGILRRMQASPVRPFVLLFAQIVVILGMTLAGMGILIAAGIVFYDIRFAGDVFSLIAAFGYGSFSFFAIGFVIAGVLPTARTAHIVSMALFYPIIFLSGATIPVEIFPASVQYVAEIIPLTHVVSLLKGVWTGQPWSAHIKELVILGIIAIACIGISAKTFKWE
ncbi:ABC transporter permease [candidate division KSB1 bacterium]